MSNIHDSEGDDMLDDYSEMFKAQKGVRGKYYNRLAEMGSEPRVRLVEEDGGDSLSERQSQRIVTLQTVYASAVIAADGQMTAQLDTNLPPGNYRVVVMIEELKASVD
jgi:hypothetical protein